jgi:hypothetical protein
MPPRTIDHLAQVAVARITLSRRAKRAFIGYERIRVLLIGWLANNAAE